MAGKAKAPAAPTSVTAADIQQMVAAMGNADSGAVASANPGAVAPLAGGQGVDPGRSEGYTPPPPAPARPMGEEMQEPAVPTQNVGDLTRAPAAPEAQPQPAPVIPGQVPGQPSALEQELAAARKLRSELEATLDRERRERETREVESRITALPETEQPQAWLEHERMLRLQAEMKVASVELKATHPLFVQFMDVVASKADIEIDPAEYRNLAEHAEPMFQSIIAQQSAQVKDQLQQQAVQQWGTRPTPEQAAPPPPDHPAISAFKEAREAFRKRPTDPDAGRRLVTANDAVLRAGFDPRTLS